MPVRNTDRLDSDVRIRDQVVAGVFDRAADADDVVDELQRRGWSREAIGVAYQDAGQHAVHRAAEETEATESAVKGAVAGGAIGGLGGLLLGIAAVTIPGFGPILAVGPLAAAIGGAAMGGAMGGLAGSFAGLGIPDRDAREYETAVREGGIFVSVRAEGGDEADQIARLFEAHHARAVNSYNAQL